MKTKY